MDLSSSITTKSNLHPNSFDEGACVNENLMDSDTEPVRYFCVNPYEVNPIVDEEREFVLRTPVPELTPKVDTAPRTLDTAGGHGFCATKQKVKLEMEEFRDLSSFLLPKPVSINSVDELNTPVFIKDAFDFDIFSNHKEKYSDELKIKLEYDAYCGNLSPTEKSIDFNILNSNKVHRNENIASGVTNVHLHSQQQYNLHQHQIFNLHTFSPDSENGSVYNCKISPPNSVDTTCAISVGNNERHYLNTSSPEIHSFNQTNNSGFETPDDSNSSILRIATVKDEKPQLLLNVDLKAQTLVGLATPAIIEDVVDLESSNFNILDLVTNDELTYMDADELFNDSPISTVTLPSQEDTTVAIAQKKSLLSEKRIRKRKICDDDEDYIPPSNKSSGRKRMSLHSETDSDSEEDRLPRSRPRGRPPKRTESVSSDGDSSKYRELRDKNNEASRKSRLKRKFKELGLEKEADELHSKNIKLKAQVEELEKMVNNFRDNVFKIMIKK